MPLPAPLRRAVFPPAVLDVLGRLAGEGHRSYVVGGAVRDLLLRRARHGLDFDLATPATPQQVTALFPRVIPTGIDHGTVTILTPGKLKVEVTTFRGEGAYTDGRRPGSVTFHTDLEADLARRDFTINAMAFDPLALELVDPFGGQRDLRGRVLRAVGDAAARFAEDGLRPLRAVRFAGQLGFRLHRATHAAIRGALPVVAQVSRERMAEELARLAVSRHVARAFALLGETGLLEVLAPPLAALPPARRRHLGAVAAAIGGEPPDLTLRLAALFHAAPVAEIEGLLTVLRFPRRVAEEVALLAARHACLRDGRPEDPVSPPVVRRWLAGVGPERLEALLTLRRAEVAALPPSRRAVAAVAAAGLARRAHAAVASGAPLTVGALALDGKALMALLGCPPGPHVGEGLRHLLDLTLDDPALNGAERLGEAARAWWATRSLIRWSGRAPAGNHLPPAGPRPTPRVMLPRRRPSRPGSPPRSRRGGPLPRPGGAGDRAGARLRRRPHHRGHRADGAAPLRAPRGGAPRRAAGEPGGGRAAAPWAARARRRLVARVRDAARGDRPGLHRRGHRQPAGAPGAAAGGRGPGRCASRWPARGAPRWPS